MGERKWTMPPRQPEDGKVEISQLDDDSLVLSVTRVLDEKRSDTDSIRMSRYNAARMFGMLSLFLGIPLPKKLGKAIKL
jgi:hypothetical protein